VLLRSRTANRKQGVRTNSAGGFVTNRNHGISLDGLDQLVGDSILNKVRIRFHVHLL
jgi:hypothetical protein